LSNDGGQQVIAPFLIIIRVATRSALTSDTDGSGTVSSILFWTHRESTGGIETHLNGNPTGSTAENGKAPGVGVETTMSPHPDEAVQRSDGR
jgi:hypothetical protein